MAAISDTEREEHENFENEVRRIARQIWPSARFDGATKIDNKETDGVFETEECIHLLEATISRRLDKAQRDITKLVGLAGKLSKRTTTKVLRCWFITKDEPTADQRRVAEKHRPLVTALSFAQFQSQLVDSHAYLSSRDNYYFGSVRDPETGDRNPKIGYIEPVLSAGAAGGVVTPTDLIEAVRYGERFSILGDYGAGKSMTLRHIYYELRKQHSRQETPRFPIYINLRDHYGQNDPAELIERHARNVGFANPWHLVRAWRAGYVHLLLDGFDEITTLNIQGLWTKLRDNRFRAMEAVRKIIRDHPRGPGLAIAGRAHFFDSDKERRNALALSNEFNEYSLNEFTDDQIHEFLQKSGLSGVVPQWLPSRPLLIASLASRGLLPAVLSKESVEPASGWDILLDHIATRESEIEAGIDGGTVRRILERLATKARATSGGLGPLMPDDLIAAFSEMCGYSPDERGMVLLQRLPGLGVDRNEEGSRAFIDADFVDACRAGDLLRFIEHPYEFEEKTLGPMECSVGVLGIAVATRACRLRQFTAKKLNAAVTRSREIAPDGLTADLVRVAYECRHAIENTLVISGVHIPEIEFTTGSPDLSRVKFDNCFFSRISIDIEVDDRMLPRFTSCFIDEIEGRVSAKDLPVGVFDDDCIIESFASSADTTHEVLALALPLGTRVVLTVLKKLYQRRGAGRRENALFRGLDHHARRLVRDALELIQKEGLAVPCKRGEDTVWLPDRRQMRRVGRIVAAPASSNDVLLQQAAELD